jgi:hypothetical protein
LWRQQIATGYPLIAWFDGHETPVSSGFAAVKETFANFTHSVENSPSEKGNRCPL